MSLIWHHSLGIRLCKIGTVQEAMSSSQIAAEVLRLTLHSAAFRQMWTHPLDCFAPTINVQWGSCWLWKCYAKTPSYENQAKDCVWMYSNTRKSLSRYYNSLLTKTWKQHILVYREKKLSFIHLVPMLLISLYPPSPHHHHHHHNSRTGSTTTQVPKSLSVIFFPTADLRQTL